MNKSPFLIIVIILGTMVGGYLLLQKDSNPRNFTEVTPLETTIPSSQVTDLTASFAIYTNGTFRVFTASMYHNLSDDVFIEAKNPNIVKVKKVGISWNDFFQILPFKLDKSCLTTGTDETFCTNSNSFLKFYLNGSENSNALNKEIGQSDKLLISYGDGSEEQIQKQLQKLDEISQ